MSRLIKTVTWQATSITLSRLDLFCFLGSQLQSFETWDSPIIRMQGKGSLGPHVLGQRLVVEPWDQSLHVGYQELASTKNMSACHTTLSHCKHPFFGEGANGVTLWKLEPKECVASKPHAPVFFLCPALVYAMHYLRRWLDMNNTRSI